jgi:hypothetical protein
MRAVHIQAWDEVFIRCRRSSVNALIVHVPSWGAWWPGLTCTPAAGGTALRLTAPRRIPRHQDLLLTVDRVRPRDKGLEFSVTGDLVGTGEWYHLDRPDGVVVHYLLQGDLQGRLALAGPGRRWLAAHRAGVRGALTELKARLEAGRTPGAEPDPRLLAHQAEELAIFAREVARHEREQAAAREQAMTGSAGTAVDGTVGDAPAAPAAEAADR